MQYKVKSVYDDDDQFANVAAEMERILNDLGREGWKPIYITPISSIGGGSDSFGTRAGVIITFAKE